MGEVLRAHLETLTTLRQGENAGDERFSWGALITFAIFPVVIGAVTWLCGVEAPGADAMLAAISILTGLLFALLVLMFERVVDEQRVEAPDSGNDPVVDAWQVLANVSWAILVSLVLLVTLFVATLFYEKAISSWLTAVIATLFLHLILTLLMVLRRVFFMAMRIAGYRRLSELRR